MLKRLWFVFAVVVLASLEPAGAQVSCVAMPEAQLLASFSDAIPGGGIKPVNMRNFVCSSYITGSPLDLTIWTTATRPVSPSPGAFGYNSTNGTSEVWTGTGWVGQNTFTGGPVSGATDFQAAGTAVTVDNTLLAKTVNVRSSSLQIYPPLHADGVTSDDAILQTAVNQCSASNGTIFLPPGQILLTGAVGTINLNDCAIVGAGVMTGKTGTGSEIDLTSTTVAPFTVGSSWSITGVNFYWPNQTGSVVYPALINITSVATDWFLNNDNILNAYIGISQPSSGTGLGRFYITGGNYYAGLDLLQLSGIGDSSHITNIHMSPGNWLQRCNNTCKAAVDAFAAGNSMLHVLTGNTVAITWDNSATFDWRWGIKVDSGGVIGISSFSIDYDGMGTILDTSAGGSYAFQDTMYGVGVANCGQQYSYVSNSFVAYHPCFNLGSATSLAIIGGHWLSSQDVFDMAGGSGLTLSNLSMTVGASANGGGNTYAVNSTGTGTFSISNVSINGHSGDTGVHGIVATTSTPNRFTLIGGSFTNLNDDITMIVSPTTIIADSWSTNTAGTNSVVFTGGVTGVLWGGNQFDKPSSPVITNNTVNGDVLLVGSPAFVDWSSGGAAVPTFGTTSVGTRFRLVNASTPPDYSIGVQPSSMWFTVPGHGGIGYAAGAGWQFYGGTAALLKLDNSGSVFAGGRLHASTALEVGSASISTTNGNTNFDVPGNIATAVAVNAAGSGYAGTDILTDSYGGAYTITVDGSGTVLTIAQFEKSSTASTVPCTTACALAGGTGTGATANLTWTAGSAIIIGQTSATIIDIGNSGATTTITGAIKAGASTGLSCSGTPTSSFASVNGIVTHC